jgi:hypothetical protein
LGLVKELTIREPQHTGEFQLRLQLAIRGACDQEEVFKLAPVHAPVAFRNIAWN